SEEDDDVYDPWAKPEHAPRSTRAVVEPDDEEPVESDEYGFSADVEDPGEALVPESAATERSVSASWELPPLTLLQRTRAQAQDRVAIEAAGRELVDALSAHGVDTHLIGFTVGPTVTRYELELGAGVKVARVTSLHKDIAYAMASPDVRILAPIPGRSAIGVEVPNRQRALVALGDLLTSEEALSSLHPLDVPIGRDIAGKTVVVNLGEMPHVLISGATGAGKSSCINSLITSLVMRASPEQVRLILVDPKRVELGQYGDLPHLLAPVVVDPKKAAGALAWAVKEMERRYDILAASGTRDITGYQQALSRGEITPPPSSARQASLSLAEATGLEVDTEEERPETLPYIVIVVDELNDLMMVAARDVEESVVRIAQMARAVGIHLVLATQRPSVDVITGVIKANVPSRMAFAVSSLADSRVILDQAGAERLIGKGDMLLVTASSNIARRLQSPWVSEEEVRRVVQYWRAQGGTTETVVALDVNAGRSSDSGGDDDDDDGLLRQARELVIRTQSGSTSMLQRKLRVGFARAGRLMDQLENEGVVAPGDGSKARKVLIAPDEFDESF
ncbi:MAG: DNA translocase FtsK, partial [Acidimicrobiaceae bacterium]|nr:DNA translocase FtsK [Acidimicrobiaceae bacterium]